MSTNLFLVGNARTALKLAFHQLGANKGCRILLPDFICDVVIHIFFEMQLEPAYYPVTAELVPDWNVLERIVSSMNCHGLLMVHYFGQPQDVEKYKSFCNRHNLWLIEDNAHGHGGTLKGKPLGGFGKVGISSPRKIARTPSGGAVYGVDELTSRLAGTFKSYPLYRPKTLLKILFQFAPVLRAFIQGFINRSKNWNDPRLFRELPQTSYKIDVYSRWRIKSVDWPVIAKQRRENWIRWELVVKKNGLLPVFKDLHKESCPWAMPVYARDIEERNAYLRWGAKNGVGIFPWPSLPETVIVRNGDAMRLWETMLCFLLDVPPKCQQIEFL